jgi:hypothetical protein
MIENLNLAIEPEIDADGFAIVRDVASANEVRELCTALGPNSQAGRRGLLAEPMVAGWARSARFVDLVRPHLAGEPRPVRAIYFDKSPETNWLRIRRLFASRPFAVARSGLRWEFRR